MRNNLLEKFVIDSLQKAGFPIFYHNLCIKKNDHIVTEYDVISNNFIIEVKGGDGVDDNAKQFQNQLKFLPNGYRLYCFCPDKNVDEIQKLNETYYPIIFTLNLEDILQREEKVFRVNVTTRRDLIKLLSLPLQKLKEYQKIYTTRENYYYTYLACKYHNDYYIPDEKISSLNELITHSIKMELLKELEIFEIVNEFDNTIPCFSSKTPRKSVEVEIDNKIQLEKTIFLPVTKNILQKIFVCNKFPYLEGITELCKCGKGYIFCKVKKEIKEYRCNQCS